MAEEATREESSIHASYYYTHFHKVPIYMINFSGLVCKISYSDIGHNLKNEMTCLFGMTKGAEAKVGV
jgi:hypothetical protein